MLTKRVSAGNYRVEKGDRVFEVSYCVSSKGWKIMEIHEASFYNGGDWWETTATLRAAKEYINNLERRAGE